MATAKKTEKKKTEQVKIVGKIQKAAETVQEKVKAYNEKYVAKTLEKGRERVKEYNEKYVNKAIEKGKEYVNSPYKKISGTMDELLSKGRSYEKDAWKKIDGYVENGRKFMYKLPMVETLEKRVTSGLSAVPSRINLPGKTDIEKLTLAMESLNANIELLKKIQVQ